MPATLRSYRVKDLMVVLFHSLDLNFNSLHHLSHISFQFGTATLVLNQTIPLC